MSIVDLVNPKEGTYFLLANEAIARAALEADVKVAAFYPGSPTSEILDSLYLAAGRIPDLKMEVAVNEKVALETVAGASMAGVRSFTAMKSVGLNVASDSFFSLGYTGIRAGCVLLFADDPHAHSSQNEEDGRFFAQAGHVPMLEPASPQEAYEMVKAAFELSERYRMLVLVRTTTRVNHTSAPVKVGNLVRTPFPHKSWSEVRAPYFTLAATARRLKGEALEKLKRIETEWETSPFNQTLEGEGDTGILCSGVSFLHLREAMDLLGLRLPVLKLGTTFPLPRNRIGRFLAGLRRLIVVEELMPYLEEAVTAIAKEANPTLEIFGKRSGTFGYVGEYDVPTVAQGLSSVVGVAPLAEVPRILERAAKLKEILPERPPIFCPGCPHRGTLWALQQAIKGKSVVVNADIGCYSMFQLPPYQITDTMLDMGATLGISSGMQHVLTDRVISLIGDSTFFHAGLPGLVNAVHNRHNFILLILDNMVTAMTGQQPNPGSDFGAAPVDRIDLKAVVEALGIKQITEISAYDPNAAVDKIKAALDLPGVSVILSRGPCALYNDRKKRQQGIPIVPNRTDPDACKNIYACVREFYCPAIDVDNETRHSEIASDLCDGCMNCARLCPIQAIQSTERSAS